MLYNGIIIITILSWLTIINGDDSILPPSLPSETSIGDSSPVTTLPANYLPPFAANDNSNNNEDNNENKRNDDKTRSKKDDENLRIKLSDTIDKVEKDEFKNKKYKDNFINYVLSYDNKKEEYNQDIERGHDSIVKDKYQLYIESDEYIKELNEESGNIGMYGHTQFSDWSLEEKKSILIDEEEMRRRLQSSSCYPFGGWGSGSSIEKSFQSWATPVQNQGSCGACWAFASIAQFELNYYIYKGQFQQKQSEQYVLDCVGDSIGTCAGGWPSQTNLWLANGGSCPSTSYYSYDGVDTWQCANCFGTKTPAGRAACITQSSTGYSGTSDGFWNIVANAAQYVGLSYWMGISNNFYYVTSGYPYWYSCGNIIGYHAMAIYGESYGNWLLIKNSWGTGWGNSGWFWLNKGAKSSCNFQADVSFNYW